MRAHTIESIRAMVAIDPISGCHVWTGDRHLNGYGRVRFHGKQHKAHRLFFEIAKGPILAGLYVCHRCHNKLCVNPEHLYAGTQRENMADMVAAGRQAAGELIAAHKRGSRNAAAKLTESEVVSMRQERAAGALLRDLAARYSVSEATVCRACRGYAWTADGESTPKRGGGFAESWT